MQNKYSNNVTSILLHEQHLQQMTSDDFCDDVPETWALVGDATEEEGLPDSVHEELDSEVQEHITQNLWFWTSVEHLLW